MEIAFSGIALEGEERTFKTLSIGCSSCAFNLKEPKRNKNTNPHAIFALMKLFLVPTPIGNLEDASPRSLRILEEMDIILAEDTRNTGILLKRFGISKPLKSFHLNNEHKVLDQYIGLIKNGQKVGLVSDAGTPAISDPGYLLVRACIEQGIEIECLPGPVAFIPALVASGLPCDRFIFEGFLPAKKGKSSKLELLSMEQRTIVFYEAPHRLLRTLKEMVPFFGLDRKVAVSRELTKLFEEHKRGSLQDLIVHFESVAPKGEIVVVVGGLPKKSAELRTE
jgi:16S rRNA (cytidine1402-2'-O)-methyltransferase